MKHATLFLDESGKSSLAEKLNEPFVLSGAILNDEEIAPVEGFFNYIKRKYKIDSDKPFHSYHIFEHPTEKLPTNKSKLLVQTLAEFVSIIPIKINIISIDKAQFKKTLGIKSEEDFKGSTERKEMREYPYRIMSAIMFEWFARYLKQSGSIGQIIVDSRRGADEQLIKSLNYCKDPTSLVDTTISNLIKERCNAICFTEKNYLSGGLEITDLISYISFFNAKSTMNSMDHIKLKSIWGQVRKRLKDRKIYKVSNEEITKFFQIGADGVHKYLKT